MINGVSFVTKGSSVLHVLGVPTFVLQALSEFTKDSLGSVLVGLRIPWFQGALPGGFSQWAIAPGPQAGRSHGTQTEETQRLQAVNIFAEISFLIEVPFSFIANKFPSLS